MTTNTQTDTDSRRADQKGFNEKAKSRQNRRRNRRVAKTATRLMTRDF